MSRRVAEIYSTLGVEDRRLEAMQLTLGHIEHLRPRRGRVGDRVTFATLGGGESPAKGSRLLLGALGELQRSGHGGRFRLLVFGFPDEAFARAAADIRGVELRGLYAPDQLDELLEEVDVGIMPSIWEEAYGYAGVEFLAKGIPVIANAIGGIVEYVRDGETGWLNRSCSAAGLAGIMRELIERPHEVAELGEQVRARRASIVMPLSRHAADMDRVYREAMAA
jgi:glycosyltransferase involved in cell wall biosynthesis